MTSLAVKFAMLGGAAAIALGAGSASAAECSDLVGMDLAHGEVTGASLVAAGAFEPPPSPFGPPPGVGGPSPYASMPAFCRVEVTLRPSDDSDIKSEVWLPAENWNGKFVGIGNGIWAGQISLSQMADPLKRGYAVASTDTGHVGNGMTAEFAIGHPEKLVDFGHRAVHETVVFAKQAIAAFYGNGPRISLWNSCSTGGRQGVMSAYRYPEDFDAISAMAPANPMTDLMTQSMWAGWWPNRAPGAKLGQPQISALHQAVVNKCDALDGLEDGIIGRPDACNFDPAEIQCTGEAGDSCLTPPQVETMRAIYGGVTDGKGTQLLPGWPLGSEMQLGMLMSGPEPFPVANTYFTMLVYGDRPGWNFRDMDYVRDVYVAREYGADILNAPATGLGPYFARGGKLLLSHGWNDGLIPATNALLFYQQLYPTLTPAQANSQVRLYMVPGMDHCAGGEGTHAFDTLAVIDEWAETGKAPYRITATRPSAPPLNLPEISRPLCPYPLYARYDGEGDPAEASSFSCAAP